MAAIDQVKGAAEPIITAIDSSVTTGLVSPGPFTELGLATVVLVIVISVHGWCLSRVSRQFTARRARLTAHSPRWRISLLTGTTVALLAITHLSETLLWTLPIWHLGLIPAMRDAYYFVLEAYTTLGEGSVTLPYDWRLLGPVIAISGLFTFSWTGSVLVYVMSEVGKLHSQKSSMTDKSGPPPPA